MPIEKALVAAQGKNNNNNNLTSNSPVVSWQDLHSAVAMMGKMLPHVIPNLNLITLLLSHSHMKASERAIRLHAYMVLILEAAKVAFVEVMLNCHNDDPTRKGGFLEVRTSPGRGDGVFAKYPVPANTILGVYPGMPWSLKDRHDFIASTGRKDLDDGMYDLQTNGIVWIPTNDDSPEKELLPAFKDCFATRINEASSSGEIPNVRHTPSLNGLVYAVSIRPIRAGEELLTWYGDAYHHRSWPIRWRQMNPLPIPDDVWRGVLSSDLSELMDISKRERESAIPVKWFTRSAPSKARHKQQQQQ